MTDNLHPVDELFSVRNEITKLKAREEELKALILDLDPRERFGRNAEASVTKTDRHTIDTKAIREEMGDDWVEARSKVSTSTVFRVRESV